MSSGLVFPRGSCSSALQLPDCLPRSTPRVPLVLDTLRQVSVVGLNFVIASSDVWAARWSALGGVSLGCTPFLVWPPCVPDGFGSIPGVWDVALSWLWHLSALGAGLGSLSRRQFGTWQGRWWALLFLGGGAPHSAFMPSVRILLSAQGCCCNVL